MILAILTCDLSFSAVRESNLRAVASVLAMMVSVGMDFGVTAKFKHSNESLFYVNYVIFDTVDLRIDCIFDNSLQ